MLLFHLYKEWPYRKWSSCLNSTWNAGSLIQLSIQTSPLSAVHHPSTKQKKTMVYHHQTAVLSPRIRAFTSVTTNPHPMSPTIPPNTPPRFQKSQRLVLHFVFHEAFSPKQLHSIKHSELVNTNFHLLSYWATELIAWYLILPDLSLLEKKYKLFF